MKIVYEKSILKRLRDARYEAARCRKTIDHVCLTKDEVEKLKNELDSQFIFPPDWQLCGYGQLPPATTVLGMKIVVEE